MKHTLKISLQLSITILFTLSLSPTFSQSWQFAESFGGMHGDASYPHNQPHNLVLDDYGNSYVFGTYGNLMELEDSTLQYYTDNTRGAFISKFNCAGEAEWFKSVAHTEQFNNSADYMILKDDYLYISGVVEINNYFKTWFLDTLVVGSILYLDFPDNCTYPWIPFRKYTYMIKMDLDGNIVDYNLLRLRVEDQSKSGWHSGLWLNPKSQRPFSIDSEGNYYMFARLQNDQKVVLYCNNEQISDTILPPSPSVTGGINVSSSYYKVKFDSDFNLLWFEPIIQDISYSDVYAINFDIYDMIGDSENNMYFVGYISTNDDELDETQLPITLDLGNGQTLETYGHQSNVGYLLKMDSDGNILWTQQTEQFYADLNPGVSSTVFESLVLDEETNSIYVEGSTMPVTNNLPTLGTIFGETDTVINTFDWGNRSGFIAKYDTEGNYNWVTIPQTSQSYTGSLSLYDNKIFSAIRWVYQFEHNEEYFENSSYYGLALCTWDLDGNPLDVINIPTTCTGMSQPVPFDTRVNNMGEIVVTGTYDYGLTFGDHEIYGEGFKMFIAKYGNPCPIITDETSNFCFGEEYNGTILTESGDYNFVLESSQPEVDSIINLHAIVYPQLTTGINDTTFCTNEPYTLQANMGYNSYDWSTGSTNSQQELTYSTVGIENVYVTLTDDNCTGIDTIVIDVTICGGINNLSNEDINLYPVPANTHVSIQLPNNEQITEVNIYDLHGKLLKTESTNTSTNYTISVNDLLPGQYMLYIKAGDKIYTGGFVKN